MIAQLGDRWILLVTGVAMLIVAGLVNWLAPAKRRRLRRTVIQFGLYLVLELVADALGASGERAWAARLGVAGDLLGAYTQVNLVALTLFDVMLPVIRLPVAFIVTDLFVGAAYLVVTFVLLRGAGMDFGSLIATSAIVSGILALSLQATLGNILGGIALQLDHSISEGDWIQLPDGQQGKVRAIHWRHTVVETRNWDTLIVPNSNLLAANILILGKREGAAPLHRMWVYFHVDFRYPPSRVIEVVRTALLAAPIERVAADPPPSVICMDLAKDGRDSFGYYAVRYWLTDLAVDDPTSSAVRERIYAALRRADIPLARAAQTIYFAPEADRSPEQRKAKRHGERLAALAGVELFSTLTDAEREHLAGHVIYAPFAAGEIITHQGAVAHWLYILVSGQAEIRVNSPDGPAKKIATLTPCAVFGEMGLLTGAPRAADVVAIGATECYRLDKAAFEQIIRERPEIADGMATVMAKRRRELFAANDAPGKAREEEDHEAAKILGKIRGFFGLGGD
jgi:small-conductance mechanosensitive channel/CRP-like cAMP-binding protein